MLRVAMSEFAKGGLAGTSTEEIARRAGISQPYLFRLYPSKKALFLAATDRCFERVQDCFASAAEGKSGQEALESMGRAYQDLLDDRELLLLQMQIYAACDDAEVQAAARQGYGRLWAYVTEASGGTDEAIVRFFATGMLLNVAAAMDLPNVKEHWAQVCCALA